MKFCQEYIPGLGVKALNKEDLFSTRHWQELKYLYNYFETFYKATIIVKGKYIGFADYF